MTRSKIRTSGAEGLTLLVQTSPLIQEIFVWYICKGVNLGVASNTDANTLEDYRKAHLTLQWKIKETQI